MSKAIAPLRVETRLAPLARLVKALGPRKSVLLAALATAAMLAARVWWKVVRVPPHLRHLPRVSFLQTVRLLLSGEGFLTSRPAFLKLLCEDALRRGAITSPAQTPRVWLEWISQRLV
ncbi:hypothetical protein H9P43_009880 [Blastocladiella emersonii ATCC 22665]|nr:hypothetical protein H9P43_009880 [Blastocladiella emersonii ATCC 22665]